MRWRCSRKLKKLQALYVKEKTTEECEHKRKRLVAAEVEMEEMRLGVVQLEPIVPTEEGV